MAATRWPTSRTRLSEQAKAAGHRFESFQSNAEHELIDRIHRARVGKDRHHPDQSRRIHAHQHRAARRVPFRADSVRRTAPVERVRARGIPPTFVSVRYRHRTHHRASARPVIASRWNSPSSGSAGPRKRKNADPAQTGRGHHGPTKNKKTDRHPRGIEPRRTRNQGRRRIRSPEPHSQRRLCAAARAGDARTRRTRARRRAGRYGSVSRARCIGGKFAAARPRGALADGRNVLRVGETRCAAVRESRPDR